MNPASTLFRDLDEGLVLTRDLGHDLDRDAARDLVRSVVLSDVERALANAHSLARSLDLDRGDGALARDLALVLSLARDAVLAFARELQVDRRRSERGRDRARAQSLGRALGDALARATELADDLEPRPDQEPASMRPAVVSRRLTGWAVRLLPVADRSEYAELFRSELYDLARSGSGRWALLGYALRVLVRAPWLRRELRAPPPAARERSW